jgi:hypothetical protein
MECSLVMGSYSGIGLRTAGFGHRICLGWLFVVTYYIMKDSDCG